MESYRAFMSECKAQIPEKDLPLVQYAMDHALTALGNAKWENGEFILHHSISVARIAVIELGLSTDSLIACLLHNTFNQTERPFSLTEITKKRKMEEAKESQNYQLSVISL